jgi:transposase
MTTAIEYEKVSPVPSLNIPELKELECVRPKNSTDSLLFHCEPVSKYRGLCLSCNKSHYHYGHGYAEDRLVHDISMGLIHVDLLVRNPRYKCNGCGGTFKHPFESIVDGQQFTTRLYEQIKIRALNGTFALIAKEYGVSETTIANILAEYSKELEKSRRVIAPRVLGIDEKHIVQKARGVLVDVERGVLLDMTPDNTADSIRNAIKNLFLYDARIECVTIDMWNTYVSVVKELIPHAVIVIDKFHVVQLIYKRTEQTRKALFAHLKAEVKQLPAEDADTIRKSELLTALGKNVYLFKFGGKKLAEKKERVSLMAELCEAFPELNQLRLIKEGAERIYEAADRAEATQRYEDWKLLIPAADDNEIYAPIYKLRRVFETWKNYIFNYFDERYQYTNAVTEGLNSLIGHLNDAGRGYGFETLRTKCLFHTSAADKPQYEWRKSKIYDFNKPKQPAIMGDTAVGYNDIMDNLFSKEQVSGGGVVISELLKNIKEVL